MSQSEVLTVELAPELKAKLDALSQSTKCSMSWLAAEAIAFYVEEQNLQISKIEQAIEIADSSGAKWVNAEDVQTWLESWGTEDEKPAPCV